MKAITCIGGKDSRDESVDFVGGEIHKYYVNGIEMEYSVTEFVHKFFPEFDSKIMARNMLNNKDFFVKEENYGKYWPHIDKFDLNDPDGFEDAVEIIIKMWKQNGDQASGDGTIMHESIELYYTEGKPLPDTPESKLFQSFDNYVKSYGYIPYRSEQTVWDVELMLAGSVDMIYVHKDDVDKSPTPALLIDWKRSKEIKMKAIGKNNTRGYGPLSSYDNCNYITYSLQLNIYKYFLEKHYNLLIDDMQLIILHPQQTDFIQKRVLPMFDIVKEIMNTRRLEISQRRQSRK